MERKKCPYCEKTILAVAKTCKHCKASLTGEDINIPTTIEPVEDESSASTRTGLTTNDSDAKKKLAALKKAAMLKKAKRQAEEVTLTPAEEIEEAAEEIIPKKETPICEEATDTTDHINECKPVEQEQTAEEVQPEDRIYETPNDVDEAESNSSEEPETVEVEEAIETEEAADAEPEQEQEPDSEQELEQEPTHEEVLAEPEIIEETEGNDENLTDEPAGTENQDENQENQAGETSSDVEQQVDEPEAKDEIAAEVPVAEDPVTETITEESSPEPTKEIEEPEEKEPAEKECSSSSWLSPKGKTGRGNYLLGIIAFIGLIALSFFSYFLTPVIVILAIWILFSVGAKRCHDLCKSGWFQIIPFYFLVMLFAKGK